MMKWLDTAKAYKEKDPSVKHLIHIILLYPGYHALGFYRISHFFYHIHFYFLASLVAMLGRFFTQIEIHPGAQIGQRLVIDHGNGVVIGETAVIGNDCLIYHGVTLGATQNDKVKRHPSIGHKVTLGAGAKVLGDIEIGDGVIVGANAVVTKSVPAYTTVAGVPAKVIKENNS